jgi:hypothetical protein
MNNYEETIPLVWEKIAEFEKEKGRKATPNERAEIFRQIHGWEFKPGDGYGSKEKPLHSF